MGFKERTFVKSRIGQKIFLTFLVIVALPLIAISFLSREISEYVLEKSTTQLLRDSTKSVGLNLLDRVRSAEAILKIQGISHASRQVNPEADARADLVFSEVRYQSLQKEAADAGSRIRIINNKNAGLEDVEIEVHDKKNGLTSVGIINPTYLWENLESAFFSLCVSGPEFRAPHCYGNPTENGANARNERPLFFRPYLDGNQWTLTAEASPNVADYLPVKLGQIFLYVAVFSLLLALSVSALFIRRATRPLDALISATQAVGSGDFAYEVPLEGMKDEYREVAKSFNSMSKTIGADVAFMQMLSAMDEAILARSPVGAIAQLPLNFLSGLSPSPPYAVRVEHSDHRDSEVFGLSDGSARQELIAQSDFSKVFWSTTGNSPPDKNLQPRLNAIKSRIAIAVSSEAHERNLVLRAARDSLTKLLNRLGLVERLDELVSDFSAKNKRLAVVYLDLDGFKEVNDAYGHDVGDKLLRLVADRMAASLKRKQLALARMGGDEFVFVLESDPDSLYKREVSTVLNDLQAYFRVDDLQIEIGASLGVSIYPDDGNGHIDLLKCADLAMYSAKARGKNQAVYFEASLNNASMERIELRRDLNHALERNQLYVVYQPRVRCDDLTHQSAEALLRWHHPEKGNIPPDKFITLAEESGQIIELGYWVLSEAANQIKAWHQQKLGKLQKISVNLSPIQLMDSMFLERIEQLVKHCGVPASCIELEVTEGALIKDVDEAVIKLTRLRQMGFAIALDDFGVGYSAMSYLSVLPFDTLKIDKSFVNGFGVQESAYAIASAIVALGKALKKNIVAEGVETEEQARVLIELGVDELQGYLYSRPIRPRDLEELLAHH